MNYAQRYKSGEPVGTLGTHSTNTFTFQVLSCNHKGNCPCSSSDVTAEIDLVTFIDGSIYYDYGFADGTVPNEEELEKVYEEYEEALYYSCGLIT